MAASNKKLRKFYSGVYKKGEELHYSSLLFSGDKVPPAKREVFKEISWAGKTVLDAGCGTGEMAYLIAKAGAKQVFGVDYSSAAIKVAKENYNLPNLNYECADLSKFRSKFDVIVSLGTLEHQDDPLHTLKKLKERLNPRGHLILTCPNWTNPRGHILMTLWFLFRAKITLADIHYLTPIEFKTWARQLNLELSWRTIDHDWGYGKKMILDLERRLPNITRDSKLPTDGKKIKEFIAWAKKHIVPMGKRNEFSGAVGLYHFKK
ncbi:hypothetical protein A3H65_04130 [Candidatus Giovannonibacteria bacterium RIFCSPLOWO2_02_FULL_45_14]|nr:MAG: hypothetical protein A3H65_04130 [Candidatus Giovannonibacteria bacterium RIFCSPLOWO2_02_FULL_45_14]